jgi:endonuclease/exonuclease/phosphatase family metal-dependent hydrolase
LTLAARYRRTAVIAALVALLVASAAGAGTAGAETGDEPVDELKAMTFNIWLGGTRVDFDMVIEAIEVADADIVGIQEPGGNLERIADELGWYHNHTQQTVSRFPLVEPPEADGDYVYAFVGPQHAVAVSNVHLTAYPYGPYELRDGATVEEVLQHEHDVHMQEMASRFASLPELADDGIPVFLLGDFNVPSHFDWTEETAEASDEDFRIALDWPVSVELDDLGFRDTYREIFPDPVSHPGYTWTPGYPPPEMTDDEVHDRIDFVYAAGPSTTTDSAVVAEDHPITDIVVEPWPSDHRAVVSTFDVEPAELQMPTVLSTDQGSYESGEAIRVDFTGASSATDWIGIFPEGGEPGDGPSLLWKYVGGSQEPTDAPPIGQVTFDADDPGEEAGTWPLAAGNYDVYFLAEDGYDVLAQTSFRVLSEDEIPSISVGQDAYEPGEGIEVSWANGSGDLASWVGIYPEGVNPGSQPSHVWSYIDGEVDGTIVLDGDSSGTTWPLPEGDYEVHLFRDNGYTVIATDAFTVVTEDEDVRPGPPEGVPPGPPSGVPPMDPPGLEIAPGLNR